MPNSQGGCNILHFSQKWTKIPLASHPCQHFVMSLMVSCFLVWFIISYCKLKIVRTCRKVLMPGKGSSPSYLPFFLFEHLWKFILNELMAFHCIFVFLKKSVSVRIEVACTGQKTQNYSGLKNIWSYFSPYESSLKKDSPGLLCDSTASEKWHHSTIYYCPIILSLSPTIV